jgi:hypothetical protein
MYLSLLEGVGELLRVSREDCGGIKVVNEGGKEAATWHRSDGEAGGERLSLLLEVVLFEPEDRANTVKRVVDNVWSGLARQIAELGLDWA